MTKFDKPRGERDYPELGLEAAVKALIDAGITYDSVETAAVGYVSEYSVGWRRASWSSLQATSTGEGEESENDRSGSTC